ncbi:MAG: helix-turn-helix transcriptional regulator [Acidimicrobiaceae bacterium]|nr:helix-turn-helix transcriptional regulator [Acidimicrobiaceae bacterium]MCY4176467.1 helix-turn-helix transcriptional regulator [Acidimicrobiaceae bacterium]MCY4281257.1 helix-turn-helix transcriptional regulator [Acidimicrobiaceae bacterium]MCY4293239.1 helix-turn-helix transcriptional regulator [Acidimicrobiaceae bacterium]
MGREVADQAQPIVFRIDSLGTLGNAVRERRRRLGMTQAELAEAAGVSRPQVSRIECGAMNPGFLVLLRLFRKLGCRLIAEPRPAGELDLDAFIDSHRQRDGAA